MERYRIIAGLEDVLEDLETALDQCARRLLRVEEAQKIITQADQELEELLPSDSTAFRIYDRSKRERTAWWKVNLSGYVERDDCENIEHWVKIVRDIINEYEPEFLRSQCVDKKQYFLPQGDTYRAMSLLLKIMKRAKKSLAVVDQYLDEDIFDYIDSLDASVDIQLISAGQKRMFRKLYDELKKTRPNMEAKECHGCHDRFLVVDGSEVWHLGASINGVGKQASTVNKLVDLEERDRFLSNLKAWLSDCSDK